MKTFEHSFEGANVQRNIACLVFSWLSPTISNIHLAPTAIFNYSVFRLLACFYVHDIVDELFECSFAFPNECLNVVIPHLFMPCLEDVRFVH